MPHRQKSAATRENLHRAGSSARTLALPVLLLLLLTAACKAYPNANRSAPICAIRDCKTGEILDDGCAKDGKCKSCVNDCGGRVAPRNGPATATLPIR